jgi:hypothetical protein
MYAGPEPGKERAWLLHMARTLIYWVSRENYGMASTCVGLMRGILQNLERKGGES